MEKKRDHFLLDVAFADLYPMYGGKKIGKVLPAIFKWALDDEETTFEDPELAEIYEAAKQNIVKVD